MKRLALFMITIFLAGLFLSCKRIRNESMTVVKDCTGSYLRYKGKDYRVCNLEMTSSFEDGVIVTATIKKIKECNGSAMNEIVCATTHDNEGWIHIEKIK